MERENITIDKKLLRDILRGERRIEYTLIYDNIISSDPEDGGADHEVVIRRNYDRKFFRLYYTDWDMTYNFHRDFPEKLTEVFPKQITKTIYQ